MLARTAVRTASLLVMTLVIFMASRAMVRFLPGDPLETIVAETGTPLSKGLLEEEFHLNQGFWSAAGQDLVGALHGDLGKSIHTRQAIAPLLGERILGSAELAFATLIVSLIVSITLGLLATGYPGSLWDRGCTAYGALSAALPTPWIGPLFMYALGVKIRLFPIGEDLRLPVLALSFGMSGLWSRIVRQRVRETLSLSQASQAARARGLPESRILLKYGLVPASGALAAYCGSQFGALLGGAFVSEVIFDWPGLGSLLVDSVLRRDYPVVEGAVFVGAVFSLMGTGLGDWMQSLLDPRIRDLKELTTS